MNATTINTFNHREDRQPRRDAAVVTPFYQRLLYILTTLGKFSPVGRR